MLARLLPLLAGLAAACGSVGDSDSGADTDFEPDAGDTDRSDTDAPALESEGWAPAGTLALLAGDVDPTTSALELRQLGEGSTCSVPAAIVSATATTPVGAPGEQLSVSLALLAPDVSGCRHTGPLTFDLALGALGPDLLPAATRMGLDDGLGVYVRLTGSAAAVGVATRTAAPDTDAPDTDAPDTDTPDTDAPDTDAPDTDALDTDAPDTDAEDTDTDAPALEGAWTITPLFGIPVPG